MLLNLALPLKSLEDILNIELFDDDIYKLAFRLVINVIFMTIIIRYLYYPITKERITYLPTI